MATVEQFKELINRYYQRDDDTKEQYEEFKSQYSYSNLKSTFESLPEIEKKFKITLPQDYKNFIEADSAWYMNGETQQFGVYDKKNIYELNWIGKHKGHSSFEELKDFYVFGQDYGEITYFLDPLNKLGYGIDAVWRVNRCSRDKRSFEFVAKDFYELIEKFCNNEDGSYERPFENEKLIVDGFVIEDILKNNVENNSDYLRIIGNWQTQIEIYIKQIEKKDIFCQIQPITYSDVEESKTYIIPFKKNIPFKILYLVQKNMYSIFFQEEIFTTVCDEDLIIKNYGKQSIKQLKEMFVFASSNSSRFVSKNTNAMDYFFVDPTNLLGRGSDAVYIICNKSKKLEEACYVAKDIVNLFRIFAEGEEINTTPIGKIK